MTTTNKKAIPKSSSVEVNSASVEVEQDEIVLIAKDIPEYWKPEEVKTEQEPVIELEPNEVVLLHEPTYIDVCSYDPKTGVFTGVIKAFECPIEKGVFYLPAYSTTKPTPETNEGEYAVFNGTEWEVLIKSIVDIATDVDLIQESERVRSQRNYLLSQSDYTMLSDFGGDKKKAIAYRQALRDIPKQKGFPLNIVWPEKEY